MPSGQVFQNLEVFMANQLDQLTQWLKEHKITEVECLISDLTGIARGKISPCLLYTSPSPRDVEESRMPSSA